MKKNYNRRKFIKSSAISGLGLTLTGSFPSHQVCLGSNLSDVATTGAQAIQGTYYEWLNYARIFIVDGYTYPFYPKIEFDAGRLAETMVDMHANVLRIA